MKKEESKPKKKQPYVEPKVIATYEKKELEETINYQGGPITNFSVLSDQSKPVMGASAHVQTQPSGDITLLDDISKNGKILVNIQNNKFEYFV